jgi:hypothetical protein
VGFVALPAGQQGADQACQAGAVFLKIPFEGPQQKTFLLAAFDMGMPVVESVLTVRRRAALHVFTQQRIVLPVDVIKGGARNRGVEHELVKIRVVADGVCDDLVDIFGRVVLQPDNG